MNVKDKKSLAKKIATWLVIGLVGVFGVGGLVYALSGSFPIGIENCNDCSFNVDGGTQGEVMGASGTRFPNGISADSTSPSAGEVRGSTFTSTGLATWASASVTGALAIGGQTTASGKVVTGGAITALTASTTQASVNAITAAQVCDSAELALTQGNSTTITWTLPAATALYADCLNDLDGANTVSVMLYNTETVTTTFIAAGTGGTLDYVSTSTLGALKQVMATFIQTNTNTYRVHLDI